jgi:hypothetical protein
VWVAGGVGSELMSAQARALLAEPDEVFPGEWKCVPCAHACYATLYVRHHGRPELERMLETRTKASIEIVCDAPRTKVGLCVPVALADRGAIGGRAPAGELPRAEAGCDVVRVVNDYF